MRPEHRQLIYDWNVQGQTRAVTQRVTFDDETLRDGLQSPSVTAPTIEQKIEILHLMAELGVDTVDIGLPGAGPHVVRDVTALAREIVDQGLPIKANCAARTVVEDVAPCVDIVQQTGLPIEVATFLGSSRIRQYTEDWDLDRMLKLAENAIGFCVKHGLANMFVTEDTTRADPETIRRLYTTALRCGSKRLVVCDTVGHATPEGAYNVVRFVKDLIRESGEDVKLDWHGHNDRGLSIANSIAAIMAGADQIHGCALGIGERVGNTPMDLLLVNLKLMGLLPDGLKRIDLKVIPRYCRAVARYTRTPIPANYPVVGKDAFETGTGVHAAAVIKAFHKGDHWLANRIYSGVPAEEFGLEQVIAVGPMSGRSNVIYWLQKRGVQPQEDLVDQIFRAAKQSPRLLTDDEIWVLVRGNTVIDEWCTA